MNDSTMLCVIAAVLIASGLWFLAIPFLAWAGIAANYEGGE